MPKRVIVFDVNETLLDLRALKPQFERVFGDGDVLYQWFGQVLQSALLTVVTGPYGDFGKVGQAALEMVAARSGVALTDADARAILGGMRTLPPRSDVLPAIQELRHAGFRLAALTNSPPAIAEAQLTNSGIAPYLDKILSVDTVRRLKPAAEVYRHRPTASAWRPSRSAWWRRTRGTSPAPCARAARRRSSPSPGWFSTRCSNRPTSSDRIWGRWRSASLPSTPATAHPYPSSSRSMHMIDLYSGPLRTVTRSPVFLETGLPYSIKPVNIGRGDQFKPDFLESHRTTACPRSSITRPPMAVGRCPCSSLALSSSTWRRSRPVSVEAAAPAR